MMTALLVAGAVFLALVLYIGVPWLALKVMRQRLSSRVEAASRVCLTFDDGPDPENTPRILRELEAAGVKATFFFLGNAVEKYPAAAAAVAAAGHEIGEHGYGHCHAWKTDPVTTLLDLLRGARAVAPYRTPRTRPLFRPAYGKLNLITFLYCLLTRRRIILWNVDPRDYTAGEAAHVVRNVTERLRPGSVVLLHDARIRPDHSRPALTAEALGLLLETEEARSSTLATVGETLSSMPPEDMARTPTGREPVSSSTR